MTPGAYRRPPRVSCRVWLLPAPAHGRLPLPCHAGCHPVGYGGDMADEAVLTELPSPLARIVQGALESEGIPARLEREAAGGVYALETGLFATRVMVPVDYLAEARALLAAVEAEHQALGDATDSDT